MNTQHDTQAMLRTFCRYQTHPGYRWALIMDDGELLCERCALANYRLVFRATRDAQLSPADRHTGYRREWAAVGVTNSGECESAETCVHCGRELWEGADYEAA